MKNMLFVVLGIVFVLNLISCGYDTGITGAEPKPQPPALEKCDGVLAIQVDPTRVDEKTACTFYGKGEGNEILTVDALALRKMNYYVIVDGACAVANNCPVQTCYPNGEKFAPCDLPGGGFGCAIDGACKGTETDGGQPTNDAGTPTSDGGYNPPDGGGGGNDGGTTTDGGCPAKDCDDSDPYSSDFVDVTSCECTHPIKTGCFGERVAIPRSADKCMWFGIGDNNPVTGWVKTNGLPLDGPDGACGVWCVDKDGNNVLFGCEGLVGPDGEHQSWAHESRSNGTCPYNNKGW